jgi:high affinity Mn2+ porin
MWSKVVLAKLATGVASVLLASQGFAGEAADERFVSSGQFTYMWHRKDSFPAAYTNLNGSPNSLSPERERSYTTTATMFLGVKPWDGGELYFVPEMITELPLSDLHGLGGSFQNGELEKNGKRQPTIYIARLFLRQTWGMGGESINVESGQMQLAKSTDSRRFVLTAGNLAVIDVFDRNAYAGDVRQQFLNMNFMTYSAFDFAADTRGYTWGLAGEYFHDDWAFRIGRFLPPREPNQQRLSFSPKNFHGDHLEIERKHRILGQAGTLRVLAFRNVADMGRWDDAIDAFIADPGKNAANCPGLSFGSTNAGAPDVCWVRKKNSKVGIGGSLEQSVTEDVGLFFRGMKADGQTEVDAFTSTDSSIAMGTIIKGTRWGRERDALGIGYAQNWISGAHVRYLSMGGIDNFIGDGKINYRPERAFELYYNINVNKFLWLTLDFQRVANPAYNADRGPVTMYGLRVHAEF